MLRIAAILFEYDKDDVVTHPKHTGLRVDQIVNSISREYPNEVSGTHPVVKTMDNAVDNNRKMLVEFQPD